MLRLIPPRRIFFQKRYYVPCYDFMGESPSPQFRQEYDKTENLFDYIKQNKNLDNKLKKRINYFERNKAQILGNDYKYMESDMCTMRSILAYYYVKYKPENKLSSQIKEEMTYFV